MSAFNPLGSDRQTAKRAVQRVVALLHQSEISAADDAAIRLGLRTFSHVKMVDPDQWDVVAANWLHSTVLHRFSPLDAVRPDLGAMKVECGDVAGLVNDGLTTIRFRRQFPKQRTETNASSDGIRSVSRIGELPDEPLVPANPDHVRQIRHVVLFEGVLDPLMDLLHRVSFMDGCGCPLTHWFPVCSLLASDNARAISFSFRMARLTMLEVHSDFGNHDSFAMLSTCCLVSRS